jgi:IS605 OrfB family transposase
MMPARRTFYRAVLLQTEATGRKLGILKSFSRDATNCANWMLQQKKNVNSNYKLMDLWPKIRKQAKESTGFNSQVVCDLVRSVSNIEGDHINDSTVKFNVPRNCKTFKTARFFFVELGLYPRKRVAVPIKKNHNLDRFFGLLGGGWTCKAFGLSPSLEVVAYLAKEKNELLSRRNVLGIDINARDFAYSILTPDGKILKQGYLGQQIWPKKRHFIERRALLQSLNALEKLKRMRRRQKNFVYTNLGQMVGEIIRLAKKFDADVSIERLSRFKPKGRTFNKKVMMVPFYEFRRILEARCFDNGITLNRVDAYHTSRWCSRCGAVGMGHDSRNYALFRCRTCSQVVNSDRKASLAVAVKTLLERNNSLNQDEFQISGRRVPVSGLFRPSPMTQRQMAVPMLTLERGKPPV